MTVQTHSMTGRHSGLFFPPTPEASSRPGLLTHDHEEDSDDHLQEQRDAKEGDEGEVVIGGWTPI